MATSINIDAPIAKQIKSYPEKDWPKLLESPGKGGRITRQVFQNIQRAIPSASIDSTRPLLCSVLLESDAVVATNGRQLVKLNCCTGLKAQEKAVIPITRFIKSPIFSEGEGCIVPGENDLFKFCTFRTSTWEYTVKCRHGVYPKYEQVIPKGSIGSLEFTKDDVENLQKEIPLLKTTDEHEVIHLYADDRTTKILPENLNEGKVLTVKGVFKGSQAVTVSINRNYLLRSFDLGFRKFSFVSAVGYDPVMAKDSSGLFVFMPLRNGDSAGIRQAASRLQSKGYRPVTPVPAKQIIEENQPENQQHKNCITKENIAMPKETNKSGFQVVGGEQADPFAHLLQQITVTQEKAREVVDQTKELTRLVKEAQRDLKAKEREFQNARQVLDKLKKVSGF